MKNNTKLTTQQYWEEYYKSDSILKNEQIINICSAYDNFWEMLIQTTKQNHQKTF